jgi:hypothetical protein
MRTRLSAFLSTVYYLWWMAPKVYRAFLDIGLSEIVFTVKERQGDEL